MRDAAALPAFLVLAFTALALTPVATALSGEAAASSAVTADSTAPVPGTRTGAVTEAVPPLVDAVSSVPAGDLSLDVPAVSAGVLEVDASASAQSSVGPVAISAGDPPPSDDGASAFTPSLADVDPVLVAAAAAPLAVVAVGVVTGGFGLRALSGNLGAWSARALRAALGVLPFGLFSRIERGQLLDNPVRARVHDAVAQDPGLTISEIQARAGIAWGTTVHHLRRLEDNGMLVSVTRGAHRRFFLANSPAAAQRTAIATLLHPTARRIATLVALRPGIDQTGLCQTLGLNGPSASKHLGQFRGQGLVASQRVGRRTLHHPTPGLHAALGFLQPTPVTWGSSAAAAMVPPQPTLVAAQ